MAWNSTSCVFFGRDVESFALLSPRAASLAGLLVPILHSSRRVSAAACYRYMFFESLTTLGDSFPFKPPRYM